MLSKDPAKEWEKFGRKDPYYGMMTCDKFRRKNLDEQGIADFFRSGREHVEYILDTIRASVHPGFSPSRALDFGCGVGRISIPLAGICQNVVGVDVSSAVLEEAKKNCVKQSLTNLEFYPSDDDLSNVTGEFDLIHSTFTLQHIPRKRGKRILRRLIELLSEDGVAVVDFLIEKEFPVPARLIGYVRKNVPIVNMIANVFYGKPLTEPLMEKNIYNMNRVMKILYENGCGNLHIRSFRNGNHLDAILFFQKRCDRPVPHETFFNEAHP